MIQPWSVLSTWRSVTLLRSGKSLREITDLSSIPARVPQVHQSCVRTLNSWTGSLFTGSDSWTELHLNRGLPGSAVYDLSTARQRSPRMLRRPRQIKIPLNSAKTDQDRKPQCACQPRTNANMLIGRDAGSTRMASTSALLSDEALLRVDAKMEKGK